MIYEATAYLNISNPFRSVIFFLRLNAELVTVDYLSIKFMIRRLSPFTGLLISTLLLANYSVAFAESLPVNVSESLRTIQEWVNGFQSKSEQEVRKILGDPTLTKTWDFNGTDQPVLKYRLQGDGRELMLYFFRGKVIKISLQFLSD